MISIGKNNLCLAPLIVPGPFDPVPLIRSHSSGGEYGGGDRLYTTPNKRLRQGRLVLHSHIS